MLEVINSWTEEHPIRMSDVMLSANKMSFL
jgi:hypothetical protein